MIGWLYWLGWAVTVGLELTSIGFNDEKMVSEC